MALISIHMKFATLLNHEAFHPGPLSKQYMKKDERLKIYGKWYTESMPHYVLLCRPHSTDFVAAALTWEQRQSKEKNKDSS